MNPVDVDIEEVLEDITKVLKERETGHSQSYHSEVREVEDVIYLLPGAWENIAQSLVSVDQSLALPKAPLLEKKSFSKRTLTPAKKSLKKLIQKLVYWYVNPVEAQLHGFHGTTARALHEVVDQLRGINVRLEIIERENLAARVNSFESERFDHRVGRLERSLRELSAGERQVAASPAPAPGELRQDTDTDEKPGKEKPSAVEHTLSSLEDPMFHFDYYWFESIHRGDRELVKKRHRPYLQYFEGCGNVLDIGSGKGEFLELLEEKKIGGYGIDIEADAVQYCIDEGLKAVVADANEHLASLDDGSLDGIFLSQVVEHLTPSELIKLVGNSYAKLKRGSSIVIETPNPQCLLIFASFFYADLSHVQPIHPETARFLLLSAGFEDVELKFINPVPRNQRLSKVVPKGSEADEPWVRELNDNIEKLNTVIFGNMDYVVTARK
ncbi:MAG: methyltransferase domain-containing protein [Actinobacteria bacterium]|nr:methyltransferase domain-containing protein [Actinomycetota bacterium]